MRRYPIRTTRRRSQRRRPNPPLRRSRSPLALHSRHQRSTHRQWLGLRSARSATAHDRRLLALSEEFASILYALRRAKGHLSPLLRSAWDSGDLLNLDMHQHLQATGTHISLIAHITQRELAQSLHRTEAHNGFANRCLWTWVERNHCLPEGGNLSPNDLSAVARELRRALDWAAATPEILFRRDHAARELWQDCYPALSQLRPGLHGAATSRAEAQVLRLSAIYAALDSSSVVGVPHLQAALAVWDYCSASASHSETPPGTPSPIVFARRSRNPPRDYPRIRLGISSMATSTATASMLPSNN
jgi:hypothetical protein